MARFPWDFDLVETLRTMIVAITLFVSNLLIIQNALGQKHFRVLRFLRLVMEDLVFGSRPQFTIALIVEF